MPLNALDAFGLDTIPLDAYPPAPVSPNPFTVDLRIYLETTLPRLPIFDGHVDQLNTVWPAASVFLVSGSDWELLSGPDGNTEETYQFDVWGLDPDTRDIAAESLRAVLQGFRGAMGSTVVTGTARGPRASTFEEISDGSDRGRYRHRVEYTFTYRTSIPVNYSR